MIRRVTRPWVALAALGCLAFLACPADEEPMGPGNDDDQLPVAAAGPDLTVSATVPVRLDGSGSIDPAGGGLTYAWSLAARPAGSAAALDDPAAERPSFVPDVAGEYRVELVVSNDAGESPPDEVAITAEDNTSSATIGDAGGEVISSDGALTVSIPAGALAEDTEIAITLVQPTQYHEDLAAIDGLSQVYDLQPEGLVLDAAATLTFTLPDGLSVEEDDVTADLWTAVQLLDDAGATAVPDGGSRAAARGGMTVVPLADQTVEFDARIDVLNERAPNFFVLLCQLALFRQVGLIRTTFPGDDAGPLHLRIRLPTLGFVDEPVEATTYFPDNPIQDLHADQFTDGWTVMQENLSENLDMVGGFNPAFTWVEIDDETRVGSMNEVVSLTETIGTFRVRVQMQLGDAVPETRVPSWIPSNFTWLPSAQIVWAADDPGTPEPFMPFAAEMAEAGDSSIGGGWLFAYADGILATSRSGEEQGRATGLDEGVTVFGALDMDFDDDGVPDLTLGLTDIGLAMALAPILGDEPLTPLDVSVPGITDNDGATTDGIRFDLTFSFAPGGDGTPPGARATTAGAVFTQFEDRNVLFLVPDGDDIIVDPNLAEAFFDDGVSVFGDDRPISVFVGPNGFTENDPMLALTVADDGSGAGEVLKLDLVGGQAVATLVDEVFVQPEPRRIRCLAGICAASSFGSNGGFGGVMFFTWDGQDAFGFIVNRITNAIGIDMIQDGDRILVGSTNFFANTYAIDELTTDGQYVDFLELPVPEGCEGPGHIMFRSAADVVITCNTSGMVVGEVFDESP